MEILFCVWQFFKLSSVVTNKEAFLVIPCCHRDKMLFNFFVSPCGDWDEMYVNVYVSPCCDWNEMLLCFRHPVEIEMRGCFCMTRCDWNEILLCFRHPVEIEMRGCFLHDPLRLKWNSVVFVSPCCDWNEVLLFSVTPSRLKWDATVWNLPCETVQHNGFTTGISNLLG
jgi:hypothetical protein